MENNSEEADRILTVALLKSFRAFEYFAAGAVLGAIIFTSISPKVVTAVLAATVCLSGCAALYIALRIRIDASLFEQWNKLDPEQLDNALIKINPGFKNGRTLELRLAGARNLFKRGVQFIALQATLTLLMIWSYVL